MRNYNFSVGFTNADQSGVVCRVRLNKRFAARDMVADFPKNVTSNFLNRFIPGPGGAGYTYRAGAGNAVEIVRREKARPLSDSERAILVNLMDFGRDFESEQSTTIDAVELPVDDPESYTAEKLLKALEAANNAAIVSMNDLMAQYPDADDDTAGEWPSEDHDRYFYQIRLAADAAIKSSDASELKSVLHALHEANMWNGYNTEQSVDEAVHSGRTGINYEIETEPQLISYLVERPSCNPALPIVWFWQRFESMLGRPAAETSIFVTAED